MSDRVRLEFLHYGSRFQWNDWTLEVRHPQGEMILCEVVEGPWVPSVKWLFMPGIMVRGSRV